LLEGFIVSFFETVTVTLNVQIGASHSLPRRCGGEKNLNTKNIAIVGLIATVLSLAVVQALAVPQYYGWRSMDWAPTSMMGGTSGHMNGNMGGMMNGNIMNGQTMNYQECQQHMETGQSQMMNAQYHQEQCEQSMGPNHSMTWQQCQTMAQ